MLTHQEGGLICLHRLPLLVSQTTEFVICIFTITSIMLHQHNSGAQFEGDLGEIIGLGIEISPYFDLREKWEFVFLKFSSCQHTIDKL